MVADLAAFAGLSPESCLALSPGEALAVADAVNRREQLWDTRFANLMALLANIHRPQHRKPYTAADFMPHDHRQQSPATPMTPEQMADLLAPMSLDKRKTK